MNADGRTLPEKVLVELHMEELYFQRDAELPAQMPLLDLKRGLLTLLQEKEPKRFSNIGAIAILYNGAVIPDTKTLADIGAWDGSILTLEATKYIRKEKNYHGIHHLG